MGSSLRVCIPIRPLHQGGGFYFVQLFREFLTRIGVTWTEDINEDFDILFVSSWQVPYDRVFRVKKERPTLRVIHRVDGSARDYGRHDDADHRQARVNMLADATIFQSHYCRFATREKFKVIRMDGPVIYNPVDVEMFNPAGQTLSLRGKVKVCNAAWSTNPKKGTWQIPELARHNPEITFVLCGQYAETTALPNVHYLGHLGHPELARVMRSCDVFLDLSENECCPNVVLQALASGLPVLYKQSGGVPELVDDAGVCLQTDLGNFRDALKDAKDRHEHLASMARERAVKHFAADVVLPRYLEVMEHAERHPPPAKWELLWGAVQGYPLLHSSLWRLPVRQIRKLAS